MADRVEREALAEDVVRKIEGIAIRSAVIRCYYRKEYRIAAAAVNAALALPAEPPRALVTPKMMSEVFAKSIRRTHPDADHIYDHRIAAELLNEMLAGASATPAPSEVPHTLFVHECTVYIRLGARVYIARQTGAQDWEFELTSLAEIPFTKIELREFGA